MECIELGFVECPDLNAGIWRGDSGIIELGFVEYPDLNARI